MRTFFSAGSGQHIVNNDKMSGQSFLESMMVSVDCQLGTMQHGRGDRILGIEDYLERDTLIVAIPLAGEPGVQKVGKTSRTQAGMHSFTAVCSWLWDQYDQFSQAHIL